MTILIIEDDPTDLKLFVEVLRTSGHEILQSASAEEALLLLQRQPVDVILVDVLLPGMDGLAFARQLKADAATRTIPILATSAVKEWPFERIAKGAGCEGFVSKPVDTRKLSGQVEKAVKK